MFIKPHGYKIIFNGQVIDWRKTKREAERMRDSLARKYRLDENQFEIREVMG